MESESPHQKLNHTFIVIFIGLILLNLLVLDVVLVFQPQSKIIEPLVTTIKKTPSENNSTPSIDLTDLTTYGQQWLSQCQEEIASAVATLSGQTQPPVKTVYQQQPAEKPSTVYIPLGGYMTTSNGSWSYIGGAEAYFNKADYSQAKKISWEAFLKIKSGNGKANARLYDATNKVVISESEILGGVDTFVLVSSPALLLLNGNNLYQVQLRSTTGYEASLDGARIKVEY